MEDKRVTAEEIQVALQGEMKELSEQIAAALNEARDGSIINDTEIPIWRATNAFREALANKAIHLVQKKHEAFSPSARRNAQPRPKNNNDTEHERTPEH
jgi:hypothetical protein